jgi:energy-coupling factor transport system substrate-specific component
MIRTEQAFRPGIGGSGLLIAVASLVGLAVFLYPFALPAIQQERTSGAARSGEAPLLLMALMVLVLAAILRELDPLRAGAGASRVVALLASMVAIGAVSRLIPSFLGATPIFLLIILGGYVFGPAFGFQLGALTLAVSAFITGGIGPWVPYQMVGVGWVGMAAGWLPSPPSRRLQLTVLAIYGVACGLLYGALLNLWFWPFAAPGGEVSPGLSWNPGLSLTETAERYLRFYLITSAPYDLFRAAGNVVLLMALGGPLLRTLERYRDRFHWQLWERAPDAPIATSPQT